MLKRRTPLKACKPRNAPTAEEKAHMAYVASLPCLVCGAQSTVHHVTSSIHGGRIARSHKRVVPLCNVAPHHQAVFDKASDPQSVEMLSHRGFYERYGIDLLAEAERIWESRNEHDG